MARDHIEELIQNIWPDYTEDAYNRIAILSNGNPGAINVLAKSCEQNSSDFLTNIETMSDLRGSQIWIAFKDHCGQDLDNFTTRVQTGDATLEEPAPQ